MNKTNFLSIILVIIFMVSCISFFNADATEEEITDINNSTASQTVVETEPTTPEPTTPEPTTPEPTTPEPTTQSTQAPTEKTTYATVADPVYTQATQKTKKTKTSSTKTEATEETEELTQASDSFDSTKETKEIKPTKATEPTTPKKNITNYGSKFRPLKWISFILMLGSAAALVYVNVRYKKLYGKQSKKVAKKGTNKSNRLTTSAKFTDSNKQNKSTDSSAIDLSSFSKKSEKNDDDLYI